MTLAWGARVSAEFRERVLTIASAVGASPSDLMACMAFETGRSFSPSVRNPGSSGTGLIQFMESTARGLGTTTEALARLTAEQQLHYVWEYFKPYAGRVGSLADCYMAILYPPAVGKEDDFPVFANRSAAYLANKGLDIDHDGAVTKRECVAFVVKLLAEGMESQNRTSDDEQPAAPIEERDTSGMPPQTENTMAEDTTATPSFDWGTITKVGGAIATFFNPIAGAAIMALSPLLQSKIETTLTKHSDPATAKVIAQNLTDVLGKTIARETGVADPFQAVVKMSASPEIIAKVEAAVVSRLDQMAPFLDKLHQQSKDEWAATEESRNESVKRVAESSIGTEVQKIVLTFSAGMVLLATVFTAVLIGLQMGMNGWKEPSGQLIILFVMLVTMSANTVRSIADWAFGSSKNSAAKYLTISEFSRK